MTGTGREADGRWPALPLAHWAKTRATLHLWTQVVGKVRLALAPPENHWWHVPLYLTARGLTTGPMPHGTGQVFQIEFDFLAHRLAITCADGAADGFAFVPMSVAEFHREPMGRLDTLGLIAPSRLTRGCRPDRRFRAARTRRERVTGGTDWSKEGNSNCRPQRIGHGPLAIT